MNDLPAAVSNVPEYTVSEISGAVKRTLEGNFGRCRLGDALLCSRAAILVRRAL